MVDNDPEQIQIYHMRELYDKIEKISGKSYSSVEEYVVSRLENEFPPEPVYTKEEKELIRERLYMLGYIEGGY